MEPSNFPLCDSRRGWTRGVVLFLLCLSLTGCASFGDFMQGFAAGQRQAEAQEQSLTFPRASAPRQINCQTQGYGGYSTTSCQ
jgi:hypothetical protein